MTRRSITLAAVAALFITTLWLTTIHAQRPPETTTEGVAYLKVNINPTPEPPLVNINPYGFVPQVAVASMPEVRIPPNPCDDPRNFESANARMIAGPMKVTFIMVGQAGNMTFTDARGMSHSFPFNSTNQFGSVIYLRAGEQLQFDSDVMYSGCRPVNG